jgi:hypothetical protein
MPAGNIAVHPHAATNDVGIRDARDFACIVNINIAAGDKCVKRQGRSFHHFFVERQLQ